MTITTTALANELGTSHDDILTLVDQLIEIDGHDAVVAAERPLTNGSGRQYGTEVTLSDTAAATIREQVA